MKNKIVRFFKTKPLIAGIASVLVLAVLVVGVAAMFGAFGNKDYSATTDLPADSTVNPNVKTTFRDNAMKITPTESDSLGVNPLSAFKLVFEKAADEKLLASSLTVEPEQAFSLKKVSDKEYNIEFDEPLEKDSIYNFILNDKDTGAKQSYAFQTKKSLNILRTLPRNQSVQVPVNSGIEITFSHENIENPEKHFQITPKVNGKFEMHKKTLVFVPEKLDEGTVYTVTIKSGIKASGSTDTLENDYSFKFQTAASQETNDRKFYFEFSNLMYNFTPTSTPALEVFADSEMYNKEVSVDLYNYSDADSFLKDLEPLSDKPFWAWYQNKEKLYDETKLTKAASVNAQIIYHQKTYWGTSYLLLPSSLPEGYYLVKVEIEGEKFYTHLQVSSSSVYIMATKDKTLAWVNDSAAGNPLSGAKISRKGSTTEATTNAEGIAVLDDLLPTLSDVTYHFYIVKPASGMPFIAPLGSNYYQPYYTYNSSDTINSYWAYIYTDKGIYLPEDTVNVWGILKPRDGSSSEVNGTLDIVRYDYSFDGDSRESILTSTKVKVSPNGTFTGSLKLSNYNPGSYEVRLSVNGKTLLSNYLQISDYTKPSYKIDIVPDRNYLFAWDKVKFDINASFYEGTPVSDVKLSYFSDLAGTRQSNGVLVSDSTGSSSHTVSPNIEISEWRPLSMYFYVSNRDAEEKEITAYSNVYVFPKDTMIEIDSQGKKGKATITTSRIDLNKLAGKPAEYYSEDEYRGAPVDMPLTVKLYERHWEKRVTGQYYDYINKVTQDKYEYDEVTNLVKEYSVSTSAGKHELSFDIVDDKNYYLEVYGRDSAGREIIETKYLYDWIYYSPFNTNTYYIADSGLSRQFKLGDSASVEVKYNKESPVDVSKNKYLFVRLKNGIIDFKVLQNSTYEFNYSENMVPNMYVKAVCFDGSNVYDAGIQQYTFDSKEKELEISVSADKESYKPGDTVKLSFDVKDVKGQPKSADINISIVDESYFAISPQYVNLLSGLYNPIVSSGIISDYVSYRSADDSGNPMAEGGEGGDMYVRNDFKDSALFKSIVSGSDGKAEVSFKLPDNLTSWRVTYQAVTGELYAGSGKMNVSSKLPFFVSTIFNKSFITADTPSMLVRAYGTAVTSTSEVSYKVTMTDDKGAEKTFTAKGTANSITEIPLPSQKAGNYTARVEAVSGTLKDAMEQKFKVSDSLLETSKTDYLTLNDSTVLSNNTKGLTTLTFYNEDSSLLYNELNSLRWSWGQRLDQKLARKISGDLLKKRFNEELYFDESFDISKYQTEDGGLAILTYGSSEPALSAKMAALTSDYIDAPALASYFRKILESEDSVHEDIAYAYWGLAALKEPVLLEIRDLIENVDNPMEIKLVLGAALAQIGDFQGAREIYDEAMAKSGKVTDTFAYVENGTRDETIEATALCSLIAMKTDAPEKIKLFNYIKSNSTTELLVNLERLIFVTNYISYADSEASFAYELDGSKRQIDLLNGSQYSLTLTPEKLSAIKFSDVKGKVIVSSSYIAPVSEIKASQDNIVSLSRAYSIDGNISTSFNRSDTIRITLTPSFGENAPDGYYEITDILPAGLRYVYNQSGLQNAYPDEVTGQKVVFGYYYSKKYYKAENIVYYARAASPGTFTADNAAIRHSDSDVSGFTGKAKIIVNK